MRDREVGNSGVRLSVVGLGGYEFEDDLGWTGARDVVDAAITSGINWIDTSEVYFDRMNERVIAAALRDSRNEVLISSKVAPQPSGTGFGSTQIREACQMSLDRLGIDRLDMYLLHYPDESDDDLEDTWTAMRGLVDEGAVRLVGLSNFDRPQIERCLGVGPVDLVQDGFSPIDYLANRELFHWCDDRGIGAVTFEPLANGMLAGAIGSPEDFARVVGDDYANWPFWQRLFSPGKFEQSQAVAQGMDAIAEDIGCTLAQLALAWNVHQPGVTATLAGSRNPVHVRQNADAASIDLTDGQLTEIEALIQLGPMFG